MAAVSSYYGKVDEVNTELYLVGKSEEGDEVTFIVALPWLEQYSGQWQPFMVPNVQGKAVAIRMSEVAANAKKGFRRKPYPNWLNDFRASLRRRSSRRTTAWATRATPSISQ